MDAPQIVPTQGLTARRLDNVADVLHEGRNSELDPAGRALCDHRMSLADAIRHLAISEVTVAGWRKEYGGMNGDEFANGIEILYTLKEAQVQREAGGATTPLCLRAEAWDTPAGPETTFPPSWPPDPDALDRPSSFAVSRSMN